MVGASRGHRDLALTIIITILILLDGCAVLDGATDRGVCLFRTTFFLVTSSHGLLLRASKASACVLTTERDRRAGHHITACVLCTLLSF